MALPGRWHGPGVRLVVPPAALPAGGGAYGGLCRGRFRWRGGGFLGGPGTPAPRQRHEVPAASGAPQQHTLQRDGPHEAALDVRQNDRQGGGAEELRDGGEAAPDGAVFERLGEVAAVAGEDGKHGEDGRDGFGHGPPGTILCGIG